MFGPTIGRGLRHRPPLMVAPRVNLAQHTLARPGAGPLHVAARTKSATLSQLNA